MGVFTTLVAESLEYTANFSVKRFLRRGHGSSTASLEG